MIGGCGSGEEERRERKRKRVKHKSQQKKKGQNKQQQQKKTDGATHSKETKHDTSLPVVSRKNVRQGKRNKRKANSTP
jgi:hypothetical protein